ncbi:hypothetical protein Moror_16870 [Moniliophthora roreri MCA 2997]|uniref:Uncharacterized protein n=1 Tax=Moniliophthora roreri (strain MCA 2997) TaxID=1381753 RepID=V2YDG7_MONRO|nr:hypothetical protein Moror_16870 [Moniliophthora roreri MCA 2997]
MNIPPSTVNVHQPPVPANPPTASDIEKANEYAEKVMYNHRVLHILDKENPQEELGRIKAYRHYVERAIFNAQPWKDMQESMKSVEHKLENVQGLLERIDDVERALGYSA